VTAWADQQGNVSTFTNVGTDVKKGTSLNGKASIDLNTGAGATHLTAASQLAAFLSAPAWTLLYIAKYTGGQADSGTSYLNPLVLGSNGTYWQATLSADHADVTQFDGAYRAERVAASAGAIHYVLQRYNGTKIQTSIDGGALGVGTSAGAIALPSDTPLLIGDTGQPGAHLFVGSLGDILGYNVAVSDADAAKLSAWIKARYAL